MADEAAVRPRGEVAVAGLLGLYAAAIATAPKPGLALALAAPLVVLPLCWWTIQAPARWVVLFLCAALLLPPLPFRLGDSGPHAAVLIAALGLLVGAVRLPEWRLRPDLLTAASMLYLAVLVASAAVAALYSGAAIAAGTLARVVLFALPVYVLLYTAYGPAANAGSPDHRRAFKAVYAAAVISAAFAVVDFYFQFPAPAGFGQQFVWLPSGVFRRAQGTFYDAMALGNVCVFFLTMVTASLLQPKSERWLSRPALAAGGVVCSTALILSFSRAALLNLTVALLVLAFVRRSRLRLRRIVAVALIALFSSLVLALALPSFAELYWGRLLGTAEFFFSAPETVLSGRADTWRAVGRFLSDHPAAWFFGVGYKTLPYSTVAGQPLIVDNTYLSTLAETGLAGLLALALFNFSILRAGFRAARNPDPRTSFFGACIFAFWVGQLFQMMSGDVLTYWRVLPVYCWVLGMAQRGSATAHEDPVS